MKTIHHHFDELPSTNGWAKEHIKHFERGALTVVSADAQTQGRGQYGRKWLAPAGKNLIVSFCFFIDQVQEPPLLLTHVLAISTTKVLADLGVNCRIKWPNDLMVDGKKIAGILCETVLLEEQLGVVIGLGLNVNMVPEALARVGQPATSLLVEMEKEYSVAEVFKKIETVFLRDLIQFVSDGFDPFLSSLTSLILPRTDKKL